MILWDVNVLVSAFRSDSPRHGDARRAVTEALDAEAPFLFLPSVAASFLRLVTNPRIFREPSSIDEAWRFLDALEDWPSAHRVDLDAMTFGVFKHLCLAAGVRGNDAADALLAASAIRHDAELVTADKGFGRFPGLSVTLL